MSDTGECTVCNGTGKNMFNETCTYCNGTGEHNILAEKYVQNHICQCITWDRKFCPICKKKCHHDSNCTPKQVIDSGFSGMGNIKSVEFNPELQEEEELIA